MTEREIEIVELNSESFERSLIPTLNSHCNEQILVDPRSVVLQTPLEHDFISQDNFSLFISPQNLPKVSKDHQRNQQC